MSRKSHLATLSAVFAITAASAEAPAPPAEPVIPPQPAAVRRLDPPPGFRPEAPEIDPRWAAAAAALIYALEWSRE